MTDYFNVERDTRGAEPYHPTSLEELYREIYFEALDLIINAISERFNQRSYKIFCAFENLLLNAITPSNANEVEDNVLNIYKDEIDFSALEVEFNVLRAIVGANTVLCFKDIYISLKTTSSATKEMIPNIMYIVKLLLVNPATSCTPERSFSTARRLKTWLCSSMKSNRFNALAILNIHKDLTDKIDIKEVGREFVSAREGRKNYFGNF